MTYFFTLVDVIETSYILHAVEKKLFSNTKSILNHGNYATMSIETYSMITAKNKVYEMKRR